MSENSKIEWTDHTFNPWEGCQKIGPGCDHCYAETRNARFAGGTAINWGPGAPRRRTSTVNWNKPRKWNKQAEAFFAEHGRRQRVFCASLADVFDNAVDPQWRADLFNLIEATPNLDWLLLTKRIGSVKNMVPLPWISKPFQHGPDPKNIYPAGWPANVWLGATIVNQEEADRDIPKLLQVPAAKRFLSMEPLLGPVNLTQIDDGHAHREVPRSEWGIVDNDDNPPGLWWDALTGERIIMHGGSTGNWSRIDASLDLIIVGGESGLKARPMHPDWVRSLRDQCESAGVPFLFKQWGEWAPSVIPSSETMECVGKKTAGRLLDGEQHDGYPSAA